MEVKVFCPDLVSISFGSMHRHGIEESYSSFTLKIFEEPPLCVTVSVPIWLCALERVDFTSYILHRWSAKCDPLRPGASSVVFPEDTQLCPFWKYSCLLWMKDNDGKVGWTQMSLSWVNRHWCWIHHQLKFLGYLQGFPHMACPAVTQP